MPAPGIFCCDANNVVNVMSLPLDIVTITRHAPNLTFQCCTLRSTPRRHISYDTHQPSLVTRDVTSHASHIAIRTYTPHFTHQHPLSFTSPCPPVRLPENAGLQPRSLVAHDFKVVFQTLNPKLSDYLNRVLGLLLLADTKRFSWPR